MPNMHSLQLGPDEIIVAIVEKGFRTITPTRLIRRQTRTEATELTDIASQARRLLDDTGYDPHDDMLALIYPAEKLSWRRLSLPLTDIGQVHETAPFEIEACSPFSADQIVTDIHILSSGPEGTDLLAVIALKNDFETYLTTIQEAGLSPDMIIAPPLSHPAMVEGIAAQVDLNASGAVVSLFDGPLPVSCSYVAGLTGDMPTDELASRIVNAVYQLVTDLSYEPPSGLMLLGELVQPEHLKRAIESQMKIAVRLPAGLDDITTDDDRSLPGDIQKGAFAKAMAAAMHMGDAARYPAFNLLKGVYQQNRSFARSGTEGRLAALFAIIFFVTLGLSFFMEGAALENEFADHKKTLRTEFRRAMPGVTTIVSETAQLHTALLELQERQKSLGARFADDDLFLDRLLDLSNALDNPTPLVASSLTYEPGLILLKGNATSIEQAEDTKKRVARLAWVTAASLRDVTPTIDKKGVTFKLELETKP